MYWRSQHYVSPSSHFFLSSFLSFSYFSFFLLDLAQALQSSSAFCILSKSFFLAWISIFLPGSMPITLQMRILNDAPIENWASASVAATLNVLNLTWIDLGHTFQTNWCKASLAFWVALLEHLLSNSHQRASGILALALLQHLMEECHGLHELGALLTEQLPFAKSTKKCYQVDSVHALASCQCLKDVEVWPLSFSSTVVHPVAARQWGMLGNAPPRKMYKWHFYTVIDSTK